MPEEFTEIRIVDNFYQSSSFFPMPVVLISTLAESGETNLGPYSLCFPHNVTGQGEYSMMLIARGDSNTAKNIIREKVCAINFIPDKKKYLKNCVTLGFPGESTEEKMKNSIFTLIPSTRSDKGANNQNPSAYPKIVREAVQVFECRWDESYPLKHKEGIVESHFLLPIDKVVMKKKWRDKLFKGRGFPPLPIDYGYRDNVRFWFTKHFRPFAVNVPENKSNPIEIVKYACGRFDPDIIWEDEACAKIVKVPNIFLKKVIEGTVEAARNEGLKVITPEFMDKIQDKRSSDKVEK